MSGRIRRLRFRYRPSRLGRFLAYALVLGGFILWMLTGGWQGPEVTSSHTVPTWTLLLASGAYFVGAFLEKFTLEDPDTPGD